MRQPIRPDILHTLDFTRNPVLAGGEEDTSRGFYDSDPEFTEPDDIKLRISREIENMECALGFGYGLHGQLHTGLPAKVQKQFLPLYLCHPDPCWLLKSKNQG